jgi:hypothetical protein
MERKEKSGTSKYGMGECTSLLEDLLKEKMRDRKKRRKVEHVLSEYGMVDYTEFVEELQKVTERGDSEDEITAVAGVVKTAEFEPRPDGDEEDFGPVGLAFLERMDPFLLADPYMVSGWVEKRFEVQLCRFYAILPHLMTGGKNYDLLSSLELGTI